MLILQINLFNMLWLFHQLTHPHVVQNDCVIRLQIFLEETRSQMPYGEKRIKPVLASEYVIRWSRTSQRILMCDAVLRPAVIDVNWLLLHSELIELCRLALDGD